MTPKFYFLIASSTFLFLSFIPRFSFAELPEGYNAVRCRRANDKTTAVHVGMDHNIPTGMFWIEKDRVTVLSNDLEHKGSVVIGSEVGGPKIYTLDYASGTFTVTENEAVVQKETNLACVFCPNDLPYCPGDEPKTAKPKE